MAEGHDSVQPAALTDYLDTLAELFRPETHAELWKALREKFGPDRKETKAFPDVHMANSFIGNMLRMELLSRGGRGQQILDESIAYLLYMAERTGTLWENVGAYASCNHGFASHIVHTLYRDVLGLYLVDVPHKKPLKLEPLLQARTQRGELCLIEQRHDEQRRPRVEGVALKFEAITAPSGARILLHHPYGRSAAPPPLGRGANA